MRVDPPDESVALLKRISELKEEAQSRVRAPQEEELPATVHASTAAEINQLRVTVQDLQRERDFLRSEMAKNRVEGDQSLLMSTLIDQGDSMRRGVGLRAVRVGEASHPGPPRMRLVGTPSELPTTVPASSGEVRRAHGGFEVLTMNDDTDSVANAVSFEESFERDLGPPTAATLVDEVEPTHRASGADFSPVSRVSSFRGAHDSDGCGRHPILWSVFWSKI